ncbi:MAG TPA: hypothetical protein EYH54_00670 [Nautiliaceae bacterium]|nr:hypothetical protein [Nautiliaceae bacterium]
MEHLTLSYIKGLILDYGIRAIVAILIVVIGYIISGIIGKIVKKLIEKTKIEKVLKEYGRDDAFGGWKISDIVGTIIKWALFAAFLSTAAVYLNWVSVSNLILAISNAILLFLLGVIIFLVGLFIADIIADYISGAEKIPNRVLVSRIVRGIIIILAADVALRSIGIDVRFLENIILIIVAGLSLGIAIAIGLAFGHALKPEAEKIVKTAKEKIKK